MALHACPRLLAWVLQHRLENKRWLVWNGMWCWSKQGPWEGGRHNWGHADLASCPARALVVGNKWLSAEPA